MQYEWMIGVRYLRSTRDERVPSIITLISVAAVAIGVTALIVVLSVMGGFEGDLRNKILGSKAHLLVTGERGEPLADPTPILEAARAVPGVVGAAQFVESELLISSPTNYSGIILRGIDLAAARTASDLESYISDGELDWLENPDAASQISAGSGELASLRRDIEELQRELDEGERTGRSARGMLARIEASGDGSGGGTGDGSAEPDGSEAPVASSTTPAGRRMPALPAPGQSAVVADQGADKEPVGRRPMPSLPAPGTTAEQFGNPMPELPPSRPRVIPGVLIGSELRDTLNVEVGDLVDLINPDGPIGPNGPMPSVRRYRIVGIYHSGLYEYDNRLVYVLIDEARDFLNIDAGAVSGVEVRIANLDAAGAAREALETALTGAGVPSFEVRDWMQLNSSLFGALLLERYVMFLLLMIMVLVASFAIICVLIMIVIQKRAEIAVLRSMGASSGAVLRIFLTQGFAIGLFGTIVGTIAGVGIALFMQLGGVPLDPEVYYIDRLPIEIDVIEVVAVVLGALGISVLATLFPSVQAARLDPASALRYE